MKVNKNTATEQQTNEKTYLVGSKEQARFLATRMWDSWECCCCGCCCCCFLSRIRYSNQNSMATILCCIHLLLLLVFPIRAFYRVLSDLATEVVAKGSSQTEGLKTKPRELALLKVPLIPIFGPLASD